jgi:hypothetical protein
MKYLQGKFTVGGDSPEYRDGWERTFGKKKLAAEAGSESFEAPADSARPVSAFNDAPAVGKEAGISPIARDVLELGPIPLGDGRQVELEPLLYAPLFCPFCCTQHVDEGEWSSRPHHKHLCAKCGKIWRVEPYTFGVKVVS